MKKILAALSFILLPLAVTAGTKQVNVQGLLTNAAGTPLTGNQTVTFQLYDVATGGAALWQDTLTVSLSSGQFNVPLGANTSMDALPFNKTYYVGIQVAGDAGEMSPRQTLAAAPYALGSVGDFRAEGSVGVGVVSTTTYSKFQVRAGLNQNIGVEGPISLGSGVALNAYNDAHTANVPLEIRSAQTFFYGNVGIGVANPQAPLDVNGYVNLTGPSQVSGDVAGTKWYLGSFNTPTGVIYGFSKPGIHQMVINANTGNVGIGTTVPGYLLDVAGTIRGNLFTESDRSLKRDIQLFAGNASEKMMRLNAVSFKWDRRAIKQRLSPSSIQAGAPAGRSVEAESAEALGFSSGPQIGLIAQDVEALFPELVETDANGVKAISYMGVTAVLLEFVKQQQMRIDALSTRVKALESK